MPNLKRPPFLHSQSTTEDLNAPNIIQFNTSIIKLDMQTLDSDSNIIGGQNCMDNESICAPYACTSSRRVQVLHCHDSPTLDMLYVDRRISWHFHLRGHLLAFCFPLPAPSLKGQNACRHQRQVCCSSPESLLFHSQLLPQSSMEEFKSASRNKRLHMNSNQPPFLASETSREGPFKFQNLVGTLKLVCGIEWIWNIRNSGTPLPKYP